MNPVLAPLAAGLLAPLMALLPAVLGSDAGGPHEDIVAASPGTGSTDLTPLPEPVMPAERSSMGFADIAKRQREAERAEQVRIEQRVIIRISPGPSGRGGGPISRDPRRGFVADFAERQAPRFAERRMGQCVPVGGIAAVQPDGPSRLILFMRDQRIVSAALEKGCNARDYYSGFLVERTNDGMICASRDKLLSRTGANCGMNKLRQLIEIDPDE